MSSPSPGKRRMDKDILKLEQKYQVTYLGGLNKFFVKFKGPKDSVYEGGVWNVKVEIPDRYPFRSPSIGFMNKIFHPNIDETSGTVCLDVINQTWTSMFELTHIFDTFLPQLLMYPNPTDPLNGEAATLHNKQEEYRKKVKDYICRFATEAICDAEQCQNQQSDSDDESSLSDFSEEECEHMEL